MKMRGSVLAAMLLLFGAGLASAQAQPKEVQDDFVKTGQSIADSLRLSTGAEIAFLPFGVLKDAVAGKSLDQAIEFPTEEVVVVRLTGQQVRSALERSLSLFPTSNPAYLYVSGMDASYKPSGLPEAKVISINVGANALNPAATYRVAGRASLGKGRLGYFTI